MTAHQAAASMLLFLGCAGGETRAVPPPPASTSAVTTTMAAPTLDAGAVRNEGRMCGGFGGISCPLGFYCKVPNRRGADLSGTCVHGVQPPLRPADLVDIAKERPE